MANQAKNETFTLHMGQNIQIKEYISRNIRNIMTIGMNEEMKQDVNKTQLNSTKPVSP